MHQPSAQTLYAKQGGGVSINPRLRYADNLGSMPCIDPLALGRLMDRVCNGHAPTLRDKVVKALGNLRKKLAR